MLRSKAKIEVKPFLNAAYLLLYRDIGYLFKD